jgi:hypothetical protein
LKEAASSQEFKPSLSPYEPAVKYRHNLLYILSDITARLIVKFCTESFRVTPYDQALQLIIFSDFIPGYYNSYPFAYRKSNVGFDEYTAPADVFELGFIISVFVA